MNYVKQLFGTDGVRGVANQELTPELALQLGRAGGAFLAGCSSRSLAGRRPRLLVGRDTRLSGPMLQSALVAGANSVGIDCVLAGVLPTPAVAYLTHKYEFDGGVMISASHNPVADNGIKFFSCDGYKLSDEQEEQIEAHLAPYGGDTLARPIADGVGDYIDQRDLTDTYVDFLKGAFPLDLRGMKVVLDCGHGAACHVAPAVFTALGADVIALNSEPDGAKINVDCGSTHPQVAQHAVVKHQADVGFSFDGDADRVWAVDEEGRLFDGDRILAALAWDRLQRGALPQNGIVATGYSNGGLARFLATMGGRLIEAPAGDRYVLGAMRDGGMVLGGEQSGHIILLEHNTTGDGLLTAVALLAVACRHGVALSALWGLMTPLPQSLKSVHVHDKEAWKTNERIAAVIEEGKRQLGPHGRILVRASGTEPVVRVMVEGDGEALVSSVATRIATCIEDELGR